MITYIDLNDYIKKRLELPENVILFEPINDSLVIEFSNGEKLTITMYDLMQYDYDIEKIKHYIIGLLLTYINCKLVEFRKWQTINL